MYSSVGDLQPEQQSEGDIDPETQQPSAKALSHLAFLVFPEEFDVSGLKYCKDDEEGISLCVMLSNLQKCKGDAVNCTVEIRPREPNQSQTVASKKATLGHILITQLAASNPAPQSE